MPEKIVAGIIGTGFIGPVHVEAARRLGNVEILAVAEANEELAQQKAEEMSIPRSYGNYQDLLADPDEVIASLRRLRHGGHDVILFHVLDQAEVEFPFEGLVELEDPESHESLELNADAYRSDYLEEIQLFRLTYERECRQSGIDYVPLDTSMQFDRALTEYLFNRRNFG